jgi:hypothetical protein
MITPDPEDARPETAPSDAAPSDTAPSETAPSETAASETAVPETTRPEGARAESAQPATSSAAEPAPDATARRVELPGDVDAAFAAIVADWVASDAPRWPHDPTEGTADAAPTEGPVAGPGTSTVPDGRGTVDAGPTPTPATPPRPRDAVSDPNGLPVGDDHFVPPEPPPLPRLGLSSLLGLALLVVGVVLLAVPGLLGGPIGLGIVPGLLAMTAGLGWLVFGLRRPREDDGADDSGVL